MVSETVLLHLHRCSDIQYPSSSQDVLYVENHYQRDIRTVCAMSVMIEDTSITIGDIKKEG